MSFIPVPEGDTKASVGVICVSCEMLWMSACGLVGTLSMSITMRPVKSVASFLEGAFPSLKWSAGIKTEIGTAYGHGWRIV